MDIEQTEQLNDTVVVVKAETDFLRRVYAWMAGGLLVTFLVAFFVTANPILMVAIFGNAVVFYGLLIAELGLVICLSARIMKMSTLTAKLVYFVYAILNGITMSLIFFAYTSSSVASAFLVTAGMFAVVSIYGYITKKDLSGVEHYAFMGLVGVILATLVNMWFKNEGFSIFLSYIIVIVFVALTAYDTQKLKALNAQLAIGSVESKKFAILGALTLYLDFINLFLAILRISGNRR